MPEEVLRLQPRVRHRRGVDLSPIDLTPGRHAAPRGCSSGRIRRPGSNGSTTQSRRFAQSPLRSSEAMSSSGCRTRWRSDGWVPNSRLRDGGHRLRGQGGSRPRSSLRSRRPATSSRWPISGRPTETRRTRLLGPLGQAPSRRRGASARARGLPWPVARWLDAPE